MNCQVCGRAIEVSQRFCPACGTRIALVAPPIGTVGYAPFPVPGPRSSRVAQHVRLLGVLWCVYGGLRLVLGLVGILVLRTMTHFSFGEGSWPLGPAFHANFPVWINAFIPLFAALTVLATVLSFATGYGLLTRKPWGRTLALVTAVLSLIKPPFGTTLGIYTLWVLAPAAAGPEYEAIPQG